MTHSAEYIGAGDVTGQSSEDAGMTNDELRAVFETWAKDEGHIVCPGRDGYEYSSMAVEIGWKNWQACHDALLERQAQWPSDEDVSHICDVVMRERAECAHKGLAPRVRLNREMRAALQSVASVQANAVPDAMAALYAAASKGFHTSETCGPDALYLHKAKFPTLQDLFDFEDAWRQAMLSAAPQPKVQP